MGDPQTGQAGLVGLEQVRDALTARIVRRDGHATYTLDADATLVEDEKRDAHWSYQGVRGDMPLLRFLFETPVCLVDEFREGNVSPGAGPLECYRQCRARMPVGKQLARYRADRASYQAALIKELEADHVRWAITADQDVTVKAVIEGIPSEAWQEPEKGCGDQVADAVHTLHATKAACRLSIKREERPQPDLCEAAPVPYAYHVVASHGPEEEKIAHEVLRWHNQRGQAGEHVNKELKVGVGLEQMPCGDSGAHAVLFRIGVLAYNLFIGFTRLACPAAWAPQTITTVRWKTDAGGRADAAPCGASGLKTRAGCGEAGRLGPHSAAVWGPQRGSLRPEWSRQQRGAGRPSREWPVSTCRPA